MHTNLFIFNLATVVSENRNGQVVYKPVLNTPGVIELSYYGNSLVAHYSLESIFITTIHNMCKQFEKRNPDTVSQNNTN